MADTLFSAPSARARSSAADALSAARGVGVPPVEHRLGPCAHGRGGGIGRRGAGHAVASEAVVVSQRRGCGGPDGGHAEGNGVGGAVTAHQGDGVVDRGSFGLVEFGDVAFDSVDQPPDPGNLLRGGGGVGAGPLVDTIDGGGQPLPGAQQIIEIAGQTSHGLSCQAAAC